MAASTLTISDRELRMPRRAPRGGPWRAIAVASVLGHVLVVGLVCSIAVPAPPQATVVTDIVFQRHAEDLVPPMRTLGGAALSMPAQASDVATLSRPRPLQLRTPPARVAANRTMPAAVIKTAPRMVAPAPPQIALSRVGPAPTVVSPKSDIVVGLEARIRHAVQDAAIYPPAARLMRVQGRAQVQFEYSQGAVGAVSLTRSSQSAMLDRAALAAVQRAVYPPAPAVIGGQVLPLMMWVNFGLVSED